MPVQQQSRYSDVCARLERGANECSFHIQQTRENTAKRDSLKNQANMLETNIRRTTLTLETLKPLMKHIQEYSSEKRAQATHAIQSALLAAGSIVPDSGGGVRFQVENGEAWFETEDGLSIDRVEGGGYRSVLSAFMRSVFLQTNPDYLQTMILDEVFAKLSVENSAALSAYLPVLAQRMQIISIEQKPEVFASTDCVSYHFLLDDGKTIVRRE